MLECVVNVSEGSDHGLIRRLRAAGGPSVIDVHADPHHNRSVFTFAGAPAVVEGAVRALAAAAVAQLDLATHRGVHPRIGVVDVVPWVDLDDPWAPSTAVSLGARDRYVGWSESELGVPCLRYGPERSLPDLRRTVDPLRLHPTAGASAVGARGVLIAYNLWLAAGGVTEARAVAHAIRGPALRALGLLVGQAAQVSCNLIAPRELGPADAYDAVAALAPIDHAELVGLLPAAVLAPIPRPRWAELDLGEDRTIEARLAPR